MNRWMNRVNKQGSEVDERWRSYHEELSEWMDENGNEADERWRSYHKELSEWMDEQG